MRININTKILKNSSRYFSRVHPSCGYLYDMIDYLLSIMTIVFDGLDNFGIIDILDVCIEGVASRKGSSTKFDIISRVISR